MKSIGDIGYRVCELRHRDGSKRYAIRLIFFDKHGKYWWHQNAWPCGKDMDDLREDLDSMKEALDQPILKFWQAPGFWEKLWCRIMRRKLRTDNGI